MRDKRDERDEALREALICAVDSRLDALSGDPWLAKKIIAEEKREEPAMKKKLTVSFALVMALMLLMLSAAVALMNSTIADRLFGGKAPEEVLEHIHAPQETAAAPLGSVSISEWLFDGSALHMSFTVANPTEETLLYTVDSIRLNGIPLTCDGLSAEGAGDAGYLLGGAVDGTSMPGSVSMYSKGAALVRYDENGKYLGEGALPEGDATLEVSVAVWKPINAPRLVDYDDYEGADVTETCDRLITDEKGYAMLWLMRPADMQVDYRANQSGAQAYAENYRTLGWAELMDTITVRVPVQLVDEVPRAVPAQTSFAWNDLRIEIEQFDMTHAGGTIVGRIRGAEAAVSAFIRDGLQVADRAGQRVLSRGCWWDDLHEDDAGLQFTIALTPIAGDLPAAVTIAPVIADDPRWNPDERLYDPTLVKPEGVVGSCQFDFTRSIDIPLEIR